MNLNSIKSIITSKTARQVLIAQKNSPTILFGAGVIGVIATVVLASRATLHLEEVVYEAQVNLDLAKTLKNKNLVNYTNKHYQRDVTIVYTRAVGSIVKLYGPAFILGGMSISSLTGSHIILTRRNVSITAAYAAVEKGFSEYRERVLGEVGEEKERELRYGVETVVEKKVGEDGKTKTVEVKRVGPNSGSVYSRFFDNRSSSWCEQPEYNLLFLRAQQNYANDKLHSRGHVLLNDVFDSLGIERTAAGCVVGWVKGNGDDFIDFGIFDGQKMDRFYDFVTGLEGAILLDFNVDGKVYDLIGKKNFK